MVSFFVRQPVVKSDAVDREVKDKVARSVEYIELDSIPPEQSALFFAPRSPVKRLDSSKMSSRGSNSAVSVNFSDQHHGKSEFRLRSPARHRHGERHAPGSDSKEKYFPRPESPIRPIYLPPSPPPPPALPHPSTWPNPPQVNFISRFLEVFLQPLNRSFRSTFSQVET
jgi:hypothetical protein